MEQKKKVNKFEKYKKRNYFLDENMRYSSGSGSCSCSEYNFGPYSYNINELGTSFMRFSIFSKVKKMKSKSSNIKKATLNKKKAKKIKVMPNNNKIQKNNDQQSKVNKTFDKTENKEYNSIYNRKTFNNSKVNADKKNKKSNQKRIQGNRNNSFFGKINNSKFGMNKVCDNNAINENYTHSHKEYRIESDYSYKNNQNIWNKDYNFDEIKGSKTRKEKIIKEVRYKIFRPDELILPVTKEIKTFEPETKLGYLDDGNKIIINEQTTLTILTSNEIIDDNEINVNDNFDGKLCKQYITKIYNTESVLSPNL